jgi:formylglycine-generating enzyme required for sulfatase activity
MRLRIPLFFGLTLLLALLTSACGRSRPNPGAPLAHDLTLDLGGGVSLKLVLIPAGKFTMGSPVTEKGHNGDEVQHEVTIDKPFYMGVYPVTMDQYGQFAKETGHVVQAMHWIAKFPQRGDYPAVYISWDDAQDFCKWLSRRSRWDMALPTDEQWEYACRAGTTTAYYWGDDPSAIGDYAWYNGNSHYVPHPVGQKKPNTWALYDMLGNAEQWTADYYPEWHRGPDDRTAVGHRVRDFKVPRGGGFAMDEIGCRAARRYGQLYYVRNFTYGMRVVVNP